MRRFETLNLSETPDTIAPDGSEIRFLPILDGGSAAHLTLKVGQTALAVAHKSVEEIWFVLSGMGEMWRKQGDQEEIVRLEPGISLTIPLGTHFQFRNTGTEPLIAVFITMPPWPGADEAYRVQDFWLVE